MTPQEYSAVVKRNSPKSKTYVNCLAAFCIGGGICAVGQGFFEAYNALGLNDKDAKTLTSVTLIFLGILLTFAGVYDKIAKHAGAGTRLRHLRRHDLRTDTMGAAYVRSNAVLIEN